MNVDNKKTKLHRKSKSKHHTWMIKTRTDYDKFYNDGNSAAGTRVRKAMQTVKTTAQDVRLHVQETKNTNN